MEEESNIWSSWSQFAAHYHEHSQRHESKIDQIIEQGKQIMATLSDLTTAIEAVQTTATTVSTQATEIEALVQPQDFQPQVDAVNAIGSTLSGISTSLAAAGAPVPLLPPTE